LNTSHGDAVARARVLAGSRNWWFLGSGGVARLTARHLTEEGRLLPSAEQRLRDLGMYKVGEPRSFLLTVLTSTDCNLGCAYCFQNTGQDPTGGDRPPRIAHARLSTDTITAALGLADRQMAARGLDKLKVLLFGGEPLLNPRGCLELLERAEDHGLTAASMISNATLLTPLLARKLWDRKLTQVQVTFDGDRDVHDHIRVRRSHGGTFDGIVRNISRASDAVPLRWNLRVNVSHHNQDGIDALIDRLAASLDLSRCVIYFVRVGDVGVGYENGLLHTTGLAARFAGWYRHAIEAGFNVPRPGPREVCGTCGHGDGRYGAVVNADGTLSSCWETAGAPGWEVGTVHDGYLPAEQIRDRWVACEDSYRFDEDAGTVASFQDTVDAALLDYLSETGRLGPRPGDRSGLTRAVA
jgi:uncharacterized protein